MVPKGAIMRTVLCSICFALVSVLAPSAQEPPIVPQFPEISPPAVPEDEIAGVYECRGVGPEGNLYGGLVQIVKSGEIYRLQWFIGDENQFGMGVVRDNVLVVSYLSRTGTGVVLYRIKPDQLVGEWMLFGLEAVYSEILIRTSEDQLPDRPDPHQLPQPKRPLKPLPGSRTA